MPSLVQKMVFLCCSFCFHGVWRISIPCRFYFRRRLKQLVCSQLIHHYSLRCCNTKMDGEPNRYDSFFVACDFTFGLDIIPRGTVTKLCWRFCLYSFYHKGEADPKSVPVTGSSLVDPSLEHYNVIQGVKL